MGWSVVQTKSGKHLTHIYTTQLDINNGMRRGDSLDLLCPASRVVLLVGCQIDMGFGRRTLG